MYPFATGKARRQLPHLEASSSSRRTARTWAGLGSGLEGWSRTRPLVRTPPRTLTLTHRLRRQFARGGLRPGSSLLDGRRAPREAREALGLLLVLLALVLPAVVRLVRVKVRVKVRARGRVKG